MHLKSASAASSRDIQRTPFPSTLWYHCIPSICHPIVRLPTNAFLFRHPILTNTILGEPLLHLVDIEPNMGLHLNILVLCGLHLHLNLFLQIRHLFTQISTSSLLKSRREKTNLFLNLLDPDPPPLNLPTPLPPLLNKLPMHPPQLLHPPLRTLTLLFSTPP